MEKKHLFLNSSSKNPRADSYGTNLDHKPFPEPIFLARGMKYRQQGGEVEGQL